MRQSQSRVLLALIIVVYVLVAALYAVRTPKWQAPDEPAHFNYVRTIAETGALPVLQPGDYDQDYLERIKAAKFPPTMPVDAIRYESYQPPLYYVAAVPFYLAARASGIDAQVLALRMFSVALEVIVLLLAFAIVREIFPGDSLLPLATAGVLATVPMHVAVTASISNDTAAELILTLVLLLSVRRIKNKVSGRHFVIFGGILFGAALLTKLTTYAPSAVLLAAAEAGKHVVNPEGERKANLWWHVVFHMGLILLLGLIISSPMFIRNMVTYGVTDPLATARHDAVVFGQPTTAGMIAQKGLNNVVVDFFAISARSFWGQFGWMGVLVDSRIYLALYLLATLALLGLGLYAVRILRRREALTAQQRWCLGLMALFVITALLAYVAYNGKFFQPQGRYLFPAIIPIALGFVIGLRELAFKEYARLLLPLLYIGMVGLDIAVLFLYIVPQLRT